MTIKSTSHYEHLQNYNITSINDFPTNADMNDICRLFKVDDTVEEYTWNGTKWIPYIETVNITIDPSTPLPVSLADDQLNISINAEQIELNTDGIESALGEPVEIPEQYSMLGRLINLATILTNLGNGNDLSDIVTSITTLADAKTITNIITAIDNLKGVDIKTLSDIINKLSNVTITSSVLPTSASTSTKQDTIISHVDGIEASLTSITTNGVSISNTPNVSVTSTVNPSNLDLSVSVLRDAITKTGVTSNTLADIVTALSNVIIIAQSNPSNLDIALSALRNSILGVNNKTLSDLLTQLITMSSNKTLADIVTQLSNVTVTSTVNPPNLDLAITTLRDSITKTGETSKTLADIVTALSSVTITNSALPTGASTSAKQDTIISHVDGIETSLTTLLAKDFATQSTLAQILAKIIASPATEAKQDTLIAKDFVTQTTLAQILSKIISAPSTEAKQDTIIGHVDGIETALTTLNGKDFATQTTLAAILSKIIESPATEAKLEAVRALLAGTLNTNITNRTTTKTATISSGTSLSTEVDLEGYQLAAIEMPSAWDAAGLTFQGSSTSNGTYKDIKANGLEVTEPGSNLTATAGVINSIDVNAMALAPIRYLKIRSGTSASAVNQTANRTLTLILKV